MKGGTKVFNERFFLDENSRKKNTFMALFDSVCFYFRFCFKIF